MKIHDTQLRLGAEPMFPWTNDQGLSEVVKRLEEFNRLYPVSEQDCAVIVGSGALLSLCDILPPTVYVTDRDPNLLAWVQATIVGLERAGMPQEYERFKGVNREALRNEERILGERHFLSSQRRFDQVRRAIGGVGIRYVEINYAKPFEMEQLAGAIDRAGQRVRVFNATNVHRYLAAEFERRRSGLGANGFIRSLETLPWSDEYRIMASSATGTSYTTCMPLMESVSEFGQKIAGERTLRSVMRTIRGKSPQAD